MYNEISANFLYHKDGILIAGILSVSRNDGTLAYI